MLLARVILFFFREKPFLFLRGVSESTNIRERKRKKKGEKAERNFFGRDINNVTAFLSLSLSLFLARAFSLFFLFACRVKSVHPIEFI